MGCYSCGGNPNTFCRDCTYPKDTWIAPVDSLPDPFMGDFDHLFRTPDGNMYALSPDRTHWILMGGAGGTVQKPQNLELNNDTRELTITRGNTVTLPNDTQNLSINGRTITISNGNAINLPEDRDTVYNDAELRRRIQAVEDKADNFVSGVTVSREGNKVKLTYTFVNGAPKEVEFEDKDTVTLAYDDTALKARVKALEDKPDKDTIYDDSVLKARIADLEARPNSNEAILERVRDLEAKQDRDNQNLTLDNNSRVLTISNGNNVTLPNDKQTIRKEGNKLILSNGGGEVELPQPNNSVSYDDSAVVNRLNALEAKEDKDTKYKAKGNGLFLDSDNNFSIDMATNTIVSRPYRLNGSNGALPATPDKRYNSGLKDGIAYAVDNDGTPQTGAFLEAGIVFNYTGNYMYEGLPNAEFSGNNFRISGTSTDASIVVANNFAMLSKDIKIESIITGQWKDSNNKVVISIRPKLVWGVQLSSHTEYYTHFLTKEEIDSGEPIVIEVKKGESLIGKLTLTLSGLSFYMQTSENRIYLKNPANNRYEKIQRLN